MGDVKRVFIVGHSGAGKGVLARSVALKLGWQFIDADVLACVFSMGRSVTDVFGPGSESHFNQTLLEILQYQITRENIAVTTDENIICDAKAREILQSEFTVNVEVSTLVQLERSPSDKIKNYRPLLPTTDYAKLLDDLHEKRDALFAEVASFTLNSDHGDIDRDAQRIVDAMV